MSSRYFSLLLFIVIVMASVSVPALAQQTLLSDEHIERIKSNCQSALGTLARIHANDAPTYINRNQTYFSIGDKMMARLNGRLALNRYDAAQLVRTASDYNARLTKFRSTYRDYDTSMAEIIRIDCRKQPVGFYEKVAETRELREKVNDVSGQLKSLIEQYRNEVILFQADNSIQLKEGQS